MYMWQPLTCVVKSGSFPKFSLSKKKKKRFLDIKHFSIEHVFGRDKLFLLTAGEENPLKRCHSWQMGCGGRVAPW